MARAMTAIARTRRGLLVTVSITAFTLSTVMSNAAATAIVLPVVLPLATRSGDRKFAAALVLCVAWGASVGGIATPVGTPPNLIGLNALRANGFDLSFLEWMAIGIPIGLVMLGAMIATLHVMLGLEHGDLPVPEVVPPQRWSAGERSVLLAITLALVGWLLPTFIEQLAPDSAATAWVRVHLPEEVVAMIAGCTLFLLPGGNGRPALVWSEATQIDWGVILLFGGGILLGQLASDNGLSEEWGRALVDGTGASSTWAITALCTATAIIMSELTSNTATCTLMAPLAFHLAHSAGAAPIPAVLGATLGSSFGFMLPISTAPNAMAYGTGRVKIREMARAGVVFDILGFALIVGGLWVMCPLLGLT
jgi:sodium-dependent dicarboxylate transporter 2/3/5